MHVNRHKIQWLYGEQIDMTHHHIKNKKWGWGWTPNPLKKKFVIFFWILFLSKNVFYDYGEKLKKKSVGGCEGANPHPPKKIFLIFFLIFLVRTFFYDDGKKCEM